VDLEENPETLDANATELRAWALQQMQETQAILERHDREYEESLAGQWNRQQGEALRQQNANESGLDDLPKHYPFMDTS